MKGPCGALDARKQLQRIFVVPARVFALALVLVLMLVPTFCPANSIEQTSSAIPGEAGDGSVSDIFNFSQQAETEAHTPKSTAVRGRSASRRITKSSVKVEANANSGTPATASSTFAAASGAAASGPAPVNPPSPGPTASFLALPDDATSFNPDTSGAVGPAHLVTALASQVRIQDRTGQTLSTVSLNGFWGTTGASNVYDPRVLYDPFAQRWIQTAVGIPSVGDPRLLVAVSQTADPTGNWNRYFVTAGSVATVFPDSPSVGFGKDRVIVQANMFSQSNFLFVRSEIWAFDKANLYAGGSARFTRFTDSNAVTEANAAIPAVNHDSISVTNFLVANWNGHADDGYGYLRVLSISGPVGGEVLNTYGSNGLFIVSQPSGNLAWDTPWASAAPEDDNFAPQRGVTNRIHIGDARIQNVSFRNGAIWCAHHIFLPWEAPTRCAVQWWAITPAGNVLHRGRVDDPRGTNFYAYPSLAVNRFEDVLIGYSRFAAGQFPSANYSFHGADSGPGTLFADAVLKAGEAKFVVPDPAGLNRWGDWSATVVDPNDSDLWTIQEYAASPSGGEDRWGTWWGRISPPASLRLFATDGTGGQAVPAGATVTYSAWVTNQLPRFATGVRLTSTLPAGAVYLSGIASQGSCLPTNGVVTCTFGDVAEEAVVSVSLQVRLTSSGSATNTLFVSGFGAEQEPADNTVKLVTTVVPPADLGLRFEGPGTVQLGSRFVCILTATNRGPAPATVVTLTNALPPGVTYVSAVPTQGSCAHNSGIVTCNLAGLASGAFARVTLTLNAVSAGWTTNRASISSTAFDSTPGDNIATLLTLINSAPTLEGLGATTINEDAVLGPIPFSVGDLETPRSNLVVTASSSNPAVVTDAGISLAIVPGTGGAQRTLTVTPVKDANGVTAITRVLRDADGGATTNSFTLTVLQLNDRPALSHVFSQTMNEDSVLGPIPFTISDVETVASNLTLSAASSDPVLIPNANLRFGGSDSTRNVTITPATNRFGTATITITVSDGQVTSSDFFTVTVAQVNDPPTLDGVANVTIDEDAPLQTVTLTGITAGPFETQLLTVRATSSAPAILPQPTVFYNSPETTGRLTFKPATNANGVATITVSVSDGMATNSRAFTVTIRAVNDPPVFTSIRRVSGSVNLTFLSEVGVNYEVEYKNSWTSSTWITLRNNISGTGAALSVTDNNASTATRFYRVRVR